MKKFLSSFASKIGPFWNKSRDITMANRVSFVAATGAMMGFYFMNTYIKSGFVRWAVTVPALAVLAITSLARLNDLGKEFSSLRWQVRRVGLILTGMGAITFLAIPFAKNPAYPTWIGSMVAWGFAMAWLTTPYMPPWHKYISGEAKAVTRKDKIV